MTMRTTVSGSDTMTRTRYPAVVPVMILLACGPGSPAPDSVGQPDAEVPGETQTSPGAESDRLDATDHPLLAADTVWSFEGVATGALPEGWRIEATRGTGEGAMWSVQPSADAPSGGKVLSLTDPRDASGSTFNLAWTDRMTFLDGTIQVEVKAGTGQEDQGGGPIWRVRDKDNYYVARWNPLEDNFRVYYVENGRRAMMAGARVFLPADEWHTITIRQEGSRIEASIDGGEPLVVNDDRFPGPGGVGVWTKADAATSFDGLRAHSLPGE